MKYVEDMKQFSVRVNTELYKELLDLCNIITTNDHEVTITPSRLMSFLIYNGLKDPVNKVLKSKHVWDTAKKLTKIDS